MAPRCCDRGTARGRLDLSQPCHCRPAARAPPIHLLTQLAFKSKPPQASRTRLPWNSLALLQRQAGRAGFVDNPASTNASTIARLRSLPLPSSFLLGHAHPLSFSPHPHFTSLPAVVIHLQKSSSTYQEHRPFRVIYAFESSKQARKEHHRTQNEQSQPRIRIPHQVLPDGFFLIVSSSLRHAWIHVVSLACIFSLSFASPNSFHIRTGFMDHAGSHPGRLDRGPWNYRLDFRPRARMGNRATRPARRSLTKVVGTQRVQTLCRY